MKIREGAYYQTRGGDVVGPLSAVSWCDRTFSALDLTWHEDGSYVQGVPGNLDLISEVYVSDTPPADAPAPEAKTLRDEFAMALMDADDFMVGFKEHAEQLYRAADAMMEARKK
jgi:hypothetical protein